MHDCIDRERKKERRKEKREKRKEKKYWKISVAFMKILILFNLITCFLLNCFSFSQTHPEVLDIVTEDTSSHCLYATAKTITTFIVFFFALFVSRTEGSSWSMFLIIIALVAVSGVSLSLRIYSAGTDALFVAFFMQPERLRQENQIIYLRFLRTTEAALR